MVIKYGAHLFVVKKGGNLLPKYLSQSFCSRNLISEALHYIRKQFTKHLLIAKTKLFHVLFYPETYK